jgi:hypothetical protein
LFSQPNQTSRENGNAFSLVSLKRDTLRLSVFCFASLQLSKTRNIGTLKSYYVQQRKKHYKSLKIKEKGPSLTLSPSVTG